MDFGDGLVALLIIGVTLVLYWLFTGIYYFRRDTSDRLTLDAETYVVVVMVMMTRFYAEHKASSEEEEQRKFRRKWLWRLKSVTIALEFLQFSSICFASAESWPSSLRTVMMAINFQIEGLAFIIVFCSALILYAGAALVLMYARKRLRAHDDAVCDLSNTELSKEELQADGDIESGKTITLLSSKARSMYMALVSFGPEVLLSLSIIPYLSLCFGAISCEYPEDSDPYLIRFPDIQCWDGLHWVMASSSLIAIAAVYPSALRFAIAKNNDTDREFRSVPKWEVLYVMAKFAVTFVPIVYVSLPYVVLPLLTCVFAWLLVGNYKLQPFLGKNAIFNHWRNASFIGCTWAALCSFALYIFTARIEIGDDKLVMLLTLVVYIVLLPVLMIKVFKKSKLFAVHLRDKAVSTLKDLSPSSSPSVLKRATNNVALLSYTEENRSRIVAAGAIPNLIECIKVTDTETLGLVCWALANMANTADIKRVMVHSNAVQYLIDVLCDDTFDICLPRTTFLLANLTGYEETSVIMMKDDILLARLTNLLSYGVSECATPALPKFKHKSKSHRKRDEHKPRHIDTKFEKEPSRTTVISPKEPSRTTVISPKEPSRTPKSSDPLISRTEPTPPPSKDVSPSASIRKLESPLSRGETKTALQARPPSPGAEQSANQTRERKLSNPAPSQSDLKSDDTRPRANSTGTGNVSVKTPPSIPSSSTPGRQSPSTATSPPPPPSSTNTPPSASLVSTNSKPKLNISLKVNEVKKVEDPFRDLTEEQRASVRKNIARIYGNIASSMDISYKTKIVSSGAVPCLVHLLTVVINDEDAQRYSLMCLSNISATPEIRDEVMECEVLTHLVRILKSKKAYSVALRASAARLVGHLALSQAHRVVLGRATMSLLISFIYEVDDIDQYRDRMHNDTDDDMEDRTPSTGFVVVVLRSIHNLLPGNVFDILKLAVPVLEIYQDDPRVEVQRLAIKGLRTLRKHGIKFVMKDGVSLDNVIIHKANGTIVLPVDAPVKSGTLGPPAAKPPPLPLPDRRSCSPTSDKDGSRTKEPSRTSGDNGPLSARSSGERARLYGVIKAWKSKATTSKPRGDDDDDREMEVTEIKQADPLPNQISESFRPQSGKIPRTKSMESLASASSDLSKSTKKTHK